MILVGGNEHDIVVMIVIVCLGSGAWLFQSLFAAINPFVQKQSRKNISASLGQVPNVSFTIVFSAYCSPVHGTSEVFIKHYLNVEKNKFEGVIGFFSLLVVLKSMGIF